MQIREFHATCAQLERERSNLIRRATNAEQQLETLQTTLAYHLARYQREIIRLRGQTGEGGSGRNQSMSQSPSCAPGSRS